MSLSALEQLSSEQLLFRLNSLQSLQNGVSPSTLAALEAELGIPDRKFCPIFPTARQLEALRCQDDELLYGGAAGGGKTFWLLMWALRGVHLSDYSCILFRRRGTDLHRANDGLIPLSFKWWGQVAKFNGQTLKWHFPSGATIGFGALDDQYAYSKYQGPSWHGVGFDEATTILPHDIPWFWSRLRRDINFPLRPQMRLTSNPGNIGHAFIKRRYITVAAREWLRAGAIGDPIFRQQVLVDESEGITRSRAFVPALLRHNKHLNAAEYRAALFELGPVEREQMLRGDWEAKAEGTFKEHWLRRWNLIGNGLHLIGSDGANEIAAIDQNSCQRFAYIDTAGTSEDKAKEARGKTPSWSVVSTFDFTPGSIGPYMIWRHAWRARVDWPGLKAGVVKALREGDGQPNWKPAERVKIEDKHWGGALAAELRSLGFTVDLLQPGSYGQKNKHDKLARSVKLQNKFENGEVFLPAKQSIWSELLEAELLSWTGDEDQEADQIDTGSYAAGDFAQSAPMVWAGSFTPGFR